MGESELPMEVDYIFLVVLAGVIANGSQDTWGKVYDVAKEGASVITGLIIDDALADELAELQKDSHG